MFILSYNYSAAVFLFIVTTEKKHKIFYILFGQHSTSLVVEVQSNQNMLQENKWINDNRKMFFFFPPQFHLFTVQSYSCHLC